MIFVPKGPLPDILAVNQDTWTLAFVTCVNNWENYDQIPARDIDPLKHYKHEEIFTALFAESRGKCVYCERVPPKDERQVEHFLPKPQYPQAAFRWENLLAVCADCNEAKANFDVGRFPIIDPSRDQPGHYLFFREEWVEVRKDLSTTEREKAERTISVLQLNRSKLVAARSDYLNKCKQQLAEEASLLSNLLLSHQPFVAMMRSFGESPRL